MVDQPDATPGSAISALGRVFVEAYRGAAATNIGKFIIEFSALELELRSAFIAVAGIDEGHADAIVASLDFARLCAVTQKLFLDGWKGHEAQQENVKKLFSECYRINNDWRVPIVHGTWVESTLVHISRNTMEAKVKISDPSVLAAETAKLIKLRESVRPILWNQVDPPFTPPWQKKSPAGKPGGAR